MTQQQRLHSRLIRVAPGAVALAALAGVIPSHLGAAGPGNLERTELIEISPLMQGISRQLAARALANPALESARAGVYAVSLDSGAVLLRKNSRLLLNPASNAKLVTSAAALTILGPSFRYKTIYSSDGEIDGDVLDGNLYVEGQGDPTITTERLLNVVHELRLLGIKRISGSIVVDSSYFDRESEAKGWEQEESDRSYHAPVGALALNFNTVSVHVRPGPMPGTPAIVTVDPPSDYIKLDSRVMTDRWQGRVYMRSYQKGTRTHVRLRGRIAADASPKRIHRKVTHPDLHFGSALAGVLNDNGIRVRRSIRRGLVPDRAQVLLYDRSQRLADIVSQLNKWSNNVIAEQIVKTLGAKVYGTPGTFANGLKAAHEFLETEVGWQHGAYVYENGSGLNDVDRFSGEQIAQLLAFMWAHPEAGAEYVSSLGVAGSQGTIVWRLRHTAAEKRLRAKTGTLRGVSALSGYVTNLAGERIVFSVMVNGYDGPTRPIWEVQDMIGEALALSGAEGPNDGISQVDLPRRAH